MVELVKKEKTELREFMLNKRKELGLKEKRKHDKAICDALKKVILLKDPKVIHSFLPIKAEIDVTPLLKWALSQNIKVVCPKVLPKRQLENLELSNFDDFDYGPFNTIHPAGNMVYRGPIDLVIMPGLAFDNDLNRLGYGGGYYDRFLLNQPNAMKVAILYSFQLVKTVPVEPHDIKVTRLILP